MMEPRLPGPPPGRPFPVSPGGPFGQYLGSNDPFWLAGIAGDHAGADISAGLAAGMAGAFAADDLFDEPEPWAPGF